MNTKKILSILLLLFGEALIIMGFIHFGQNVRTKILILNIIISSFIYSLLFIDILIPWFDFKDNTNKKIGSIGLRWVFTISYLILAIGAMVYFDKIKPTLFFDQALIQGIIFFVCLMGFLLTFSASGKVEKVYVDEKFHYDGIDAMKQAAKKTKEQMNKTENIPSTLISRIDTLQQNLRYLSPCNKEEAIVIENKFVNEMRDLYDSISETPLNFESIDKTIKACETIYQERKQIISK